MQEIQLIRSNNKNERLLNSKFSLKKIALVFDKTNYNDNMSIFKDIQFIINQNSSLLQCYSYA